MSTTYKALGGETFGDISRRVYGTGEKSGTLRGANPSLSEPLRSGDVVTVPRTTTSRLQTNPDGVAIILGGESFKHFTEFRATLNLDGIDTLELVAPFDPLDASQQAKFKPFQYLDTTAIVDGVDLFTGTAIDVVPRVSADATSVSIGAYSKAGVLAECDLIPREFSNKTLAQIATELTKPFGVKVGFEAGAGEKFTRIGYEGSVWDFLIKLAKSRGLLLSTTKSGGVKFFKVPSISDSVANFSEGEAPLLGISPDFNAQGLYSEVVGRSQTKKKVKGITHTERYELGVYRPTFKHYRDVSRKALPSVVRASVGRMKAERRAYNIDVATWYTATGELFEPGHTVTLKSPSVFLPDPVALLVRSVTLNQSGDSKTATLRLVEQGVYS